MSKSEWKKWPEVQYRVAPNDDGVMCAHIRTYTEDETGKVTGHQAKVEFCPAIDDETKSSLVELVKYSVARSIGVQPQRAEEGIAP